jgi:hypothetical protein
MGTMKITTEQKAALNKFKNANGRNWKSCLMTEWQSGRYSCPKSDTHLLQQIRNTVGPSGLKTL